MKRIVSHDYVDSARETMVYIDMFHLSESEREYYECIDYLYKCKENPSNFECTEDWLEYNFGVYTIDDAIAITYTKEYQFLVNHDYIDYSQYGGLCKRHSCTFVNSEIVVVQCDCYYDV